ncbi:MAG TPA: MarR family transcriptional regulator [Acidimicrobiales bacterium]
MSTVEDVADRLHSAAIHVLRLVRREDAATGLSAARLSALSVLVFGGDRTVGQLAAAEQVRSPTMSGLVAEMEREGLVERRPSAADGRSVVVSATQEGRRVLHEGRRRRVAALAERLAGLDHDEVALLGEAAALLERISRS